MFINQILTKLKSLVYSKSETDSLLGGKANSSHTHTKSQITDFPSLATVATSGSYNDLSNKPSIPSIDLRPQASADANTVSDGVSITHYGSNGPSTSLGASTDDGALFQQCWSSAWKVQIAADYRNGNLFTRGKNNGTWQPWRAVAYHGDNVSKFTNDSGYITSSGSCNYANSAGYASSAGSAGEVNTSVAAGSTKDLVYASMADNDYCWIRCGGASDAGYLEIATGDNGDDPIYVRQYPWASNESPRTLTLLDGSGNTSFPGTVTAPTFSGNLNGNCSGTAGSVAWGNVSGRPTALSQFTNDSGFLTSADRLPIGSYIQFAGSQAPAGFLVCNGGAISRTTYSALFAVIGTTYGSGDGSTTFNLPNLTDRFLQGSTTSGTVKDAGLPNITGDSAGHYHVTGSAPTTFQFGAIRTSVERNWYVSPNGNDGSEPRGISEQVFDASQSNPIYGNSDTVQPPALTCLICIKY